MEWMAVHSFMQLFFDFMDLCSSYEWPNNHTKREEIKKALEIANHVQLSVNKMKLSNCYHRFSTLCVDENFSQTFFKNCLSDPPKYILKKVINSDSNVKFIDYAIDIFKTLLSEERLIGALSELMVEAASKETLVRNMATDLSAHQLQEFKQYLHLFGILQSDSDKMTTGTLISCSQEIMDTLVLCLVSDNIGGLKKDDTELVRKNIIIGFTIIMNERHISGQKFWEHLFGVDKENLIKMCLQYDSLRKMLFETVIYNCSLCVTGFKTTGKIYFSKHQMISKCNTLFENETLKFEFKKFVKDNNHEELVKSFF